ncbi:hypothetical protein PM082_007379 [Marasmius tenuissimus]|nr:hypothetical protein PM082_007379 [Marasmius tenuissimus]
MTQSDDSETLNGFGAINTGGYPSDVADNYANDQSLYKNMEIVVENCLCRVIMHDTRTVGIEHVSEDERPSRAAHGPTPRLSPERTPHAS